MNVRTLCFIPARGGSKRIPRKNVLPLAGKPLLAYTLEAARDAKLFNEIVVSSDDDEILAVADEYKVAADRRPPELGGDHVRFVEVLEEFLRRDPTRFDHIAVLLPTCPFRTADDIRAAHVMLKNAPEPSFVVSISEYEFPPQFACDFDGTRLTLREPTTYAASTQSQSVGKSYHPNGAIYFAHVARFLREQSFFAEPLLGYLMPPERAFDIDHPYQFQIAEAMMRLQKKLSS